MSEQPSVEMLCRAADEAYYGRKHTDADWRTRWEFYTNPYNTSRGGQWFVLSIVEAVLAALVPPNVDGTLGDTSNTDAAQENQR